MTEDQKLCELFKVEDEIADVHGIETEHFLLLREEYRKHGGEQKIEDESTKVDESVLTSEIIELTQDVEKQPDEMTLTESRGGWSPTQKESWLMKSMENIMPIFDDSNPKIERTKTGVLVPFEKLMRIQKIMTPRTSPNYLKFRRQLY